MGAKRSRPATQKPVQECIQRFRQAGQTQLQVEFPDPTYASGIIEGVNIKGKQIGDLKVVQLTITLDIIKTIITVPMFSATASTYLFRNAVEGIIVMCQLLSVDQIWLQSCPCRYKHLAVATDRPDVVAVSPLLPGG
jgi:hypothetical protein